MNHNDTSVPSAAAKWLVAIRPFALSASTTPVVFGTLLAVIVGGAAFRPFLCVLALLAMVMLHSGANMVSDVHDFRRGLDKAPTPLSGAIVRGWLTADQVLAGAILLLVVGCLIGLTLVAIVGRPLLWIGLGGLAIGISYAAPPLSLKYRGMGDLAVFLDFGVLGAVGAWTVQTGHPSWLPAVWAVPMSLPVVAILHANNWRDAATDTQCNVVTVASRLGDRGSLIYYGFLIFAPFALVAILMAFRWLPPASPYGMPSASAVTWIALPLALERWRRARTRHNPKRPLDFIALDGATAQLNLAFGLLCSVALVLHELIEIWIR
jgi:1,4-dihydroxy-2-naphthoate polyprenyltransferase